MSRKLRRIGIVFLASGIVILNLSFFGVFSLIGDCAGTVSDCVGYDRWHNTSKAGIVLLFIGAVVLIVGLIKQKQNPQALDVSDKSKRKK